MLYQQILILTIYKVSNSSGCYPVAKFHQDQQGWQREQLRTSVTFQAGASISTSHGPHEVWLKSASQCLHLARIGNVPILLSFYTCVTIGRESSVHSAFNMLLARVARLALSWLISKKLAIFEVRWPWKKHFAIFSVCHCEMKFSLSILAFCIVWTGFLSQLQ